MVVVSNPLVVHNLLDAVLISLLREVMCTVPGQGEAAGQQGLTEVVAGPLTGRWALMDLGFLVTVIVAMTVLFLLYFGVLVLVTLTVGFFLYLGVLVLVALPVGFLMYLCFLDSHLLH